MSMRGAQFPPEERPLSLTWPPPASGCGYVFTERVCRTTSRANEGALARPSPMMAKATILVVDDTPADRMLLARALTAEGYVVSSAENGDVALASVAACPPELILLDVRMPGIDGFEVSVPPQGSGSRSTRLEGPVRHLPAPDQALQHLAHFAGRPMELTLVNGVLVQFKELP
jgi:Response regulator receiver domain